ncbi:MAG: dihydrofolate reductase family protein [Candidatus Eisenbacteria bacterium]
MRRVVVATLDPNPSVRGRGVARLRKAGIEVEIGPGAREALALNLPYFQRHLYERAWIELKEAITLDGRVADSGGRSRWITGPEARRIVHRDRARADALVIGAGTLRADDPELTVRDTPGSTPTRIVIDSRLRISPEARVWQAWHADSGGRRPGSEGRPIGRRDTPTVSGNFVRRSDGRWLRRPRLILATVRGVPGGRLERFRERGWEPWLLPARGGHVSLPALARRAAREGLHHLLVEAGPTLAQAWLEADLVDALTLYMAPKVLGGRFGWTGSFQSPLARAPHWESVALDRIGEEGCWRLRRPGVLDRMADDVHRIG